MDERARREALDVRRSLLLQAPAGSGKTTVLTARFWRCWRRRMRPKRSWRSPSRARPPPRCAIASWRRCRQPRSTAPSRASTPGCWSRPVRAIAPAAGSCGDNAARLRIETIDALTIGWPVRCRSRHAVDRRLRSRATPGPLYRQAARAALRAALRTARNRGRRSQLLLDRLDNSWLRLERLLAEMLARRSHWLPRMLQAHSGGLVQRVTESLDTVLRADWPDAARSICGRSCCARPSAAGACAASGCSARRCSARADRVCVHWRALVRAGADRAGRWRQTVHRARGLRAQRRWAAEAARCATGSMR